MKVEPSRVFTRKNFDLYVNVPISFKTAALGGKIKVPLIDTTMDYVIPEGTQSGKIFFERGKGIKSSRGTGDLYIVVTVETPTKLTAKQKADLTDLEEQSDARQTPAIKGFKDVMQSMYGVDPYVK